MADQRAPRYTPKSNDPVDALIGEFMEVKRREREEEREQARRSVPQKRSPLLLGVLLALCVVVWAAPSFLPARIATIPPETIERSALANLYLASLRIREYLATHKKLPESLAEAGADTTGIVYWRSTNSQFELSTRVEGARITYRSSVPDSVFLGPNLRIRGIS